MNSEGNNNHAYEIMLVLSNVEFGIDRAVFIITLIYRSILRYMFPFPQEKKTGMMIYIYTFPL